MPIWNVYLDPKNTWVENIQSEKLEWIKKNTNNVFVLNQQQLNINSIKLLIGKN